MNRTTPMWGWVLPLLVAVAVAGIGWWADRAVRDAVESKLRSEMETVLDANVTALEIWIQTQHRIASGIVEDPSVRRAALDLIESSATAGTNRQALSRLSEQRAFDQGIQARLKAAGYFVANLVNTNLVFVGDSGPGKFRLGSTAPEEHQVQLVELMESGNPVVITPFKPKWSGGRGRPDRVGRLPTAEGSTPRGAGGEATGRAPWQRPEARMGEGARPENSRPDGARPDGPRPAGGRPRSGMMMVAVPVRDDAGSIRGALGMILNPELEFSKILSVVRQGKSGETYAFNDSGLMLSQSRFDDRLKAVGLLEERDGATSALTLELKDPGAALLAGVPIATNRNGWPLTAMVAKAVAGEAGVTVDPVRDYRGVPVVGAWRWLPNQRFGIVTQMDAIEAFRPLRALRSVFLLLVGLLAVAALAAMLVSYGNATWRRKATEAELKLKNLGQYQLEEKIGEGGMGVVYRARHALLRRDTAVKLLLPGRADRAAVERFEDEVRLTCGLTHPNTIQIYDFGRTPDGVFYYAMELLRGLNLAELVARHGRQPPERIIHILRQVCDSLQEAHDAGLVHRDIKPANIFLCERGGMPDTVKVLDFGLVERVAKGSRGAPTDPGQRRVSGTPNYLPPETIQNPEISDPRGDLYALGAVAYYLATGEPLFSRDSVTEILESHLSEVPVPPKVRGADGLSAPLESLILQCLEKNPEARPQSAAEVRRALDACPEANAWTPARRAEWWARTSVAAVHGPAASEGLTRDETLKVDLTQRLQDG